MSNPFALHNRKDRRAKVQQVSGPMCTLGEPSERNEEAEAEVKDYLTKQFASIHAREKAWKDRKKATELDSTLLNAPGSAGAQANPNDGDVPLAQPSRAGPKQKTLLEIAAERQLITQSSSKNPDLSPENTSVVTINPDGSLSHSTPETTTEGEEVISPYLDIALYTITLLFLHFTLTLLVTQQYSQTSPELWPLFLSSTVFGRTPPLLLLLVSILHPRASHPAMQVGFTAIAIGAGAYLVKISNEDPYMAVMRQAPELGTLWVWSVIECRWELALGGLVAVAGWGWTKGYGFR